MICWAIRPGPFRGNSPESPLQRLRATADPTAFQPLEDDSSGELREQPRESFPARSLIISIRDCKSAPVPAATIAVQDIHGPFSVGLSDALGQCTLEVPEDVRITELRVQKTGYAAAVRYLADNETSAITVIIDRFPISGGELRFTDGSAAKSIQVVAVPKTIWDKAYAMWPDRAAEALDNLLVHQKSVATVSDERGVYSLCDLEEPAGYVLLIGGQGLVLPGPPPDVQLGYQGMVFNVIRCMTVCFDLVEPNGRPVQVPSQSLFGQVDIRVLPVPALAPLDNCWLSALLAGLPREALMSSEGHFVGLFANPSGRTDLTVNVRARVAGHSPLTERLQPRYLNQFTGADRLMLAPLFEGTGKLNLQWRNLPECARHVSPHTTKQYRIQLRSIDGFSRVLYDLSVDPDDNGEAAIDDVGWGDYDARYASAGDGLSGAAVQLPMQRVRIGSIPTTLIIECAHSGCIDLVPTLPNGEKYVGQLSVSVFRRGERSGRITPLIFNGFPYRIIGLQPGPQELSASGNGSARRIRLATVVESEAVVELPFNIEGD